MHRNEQFENIAKFKRSYLRQGYPVISVDTKKKEVIGEYSRSNDSIYGKETQITLDHDFQTPNSIIGVPHGIYDEKENSGYITIGKSSDTSEFVCDNIKSWWLKIGILLYPFAKHLLILCDGGGSNSSRHYIFKEDLQKLALTIGINIRIAHYPPYCSKWNPIEHKLFPYVSKAIRGANITSLQKLGEYIKRTKTKTGLRVVVKISKKNYNTGRKVQDGFKEDMSIKFDKILPLWNYVAKCN